jgi:hypothetical protein
MKDLGLYSAKQCAKDYSEYSITLSHDSVSNE